MKEKEYIYEVLRLAKDKNIKIRAIYLDKENFDNIVNHLASVANRVFEPVMNEISLNTEYGTIHVLADRHEVQIGVRDEQSNSND
jgi:hypothetical protein